MHHLPLQVIRHLVDVIPGDMPPVDAGLTTYKLIHTCARQTALRICCFLVPIHKICQRESEGTTGWGDHIADEGAGEEEVGLSERCWQRRKYVCTQQKIGVSIYPGSPVYPYLPVN